MKRSAQSVLEQIQLKHPHITMDCDTYKGMQQKALFYESGISEGFWTKPNNFINGKQKGHPLLAAERRKKTNIERYGGVSPCNSSVILEKVKKAVFLKYGVENAFQSENCKIKIRQTNLDKYGVENPAKNENIRNKIKQTSLDKYGVDCNLKLETTKSKIKQTNVDRYGASHPMQNADVLGKARQTLIDNGKCSSGEMELKAFIESMGVITKKKYIGGNPGVEIDIWCQNLNIAFEYNGDYWHSEARSGNHFLHLLKTEKCFNKGVKLVHIFDSEWQNKKEIVKDFVRSKLGISNQKYMARKLQIKEVSKKETVAFFNENHLQGSPIYWKTFGLYESDNLIAAAAFSLPHRQNMSNEPHLSRFACKLGVNVAGGLSRLCSYAYSQIGPFISFVHLRLSDGNSYLKAGFKLLEKQKPDYWYWDTKKNKTVSKQSRKKGSVHTPENTTEKDHAAKDGLYRIWDCGKLKFRYAKHD